MVQQHISLLYFVHFCNIVRAMFAGVIIMIEGIANVGGLAGTQMPERVLSDSYEKGGKQMIGKFQSEDISSLGFILNVPQSCIKSQNVLLETV